MSPRAVMLLCALSLSACAVVGEDWRRPSADAPARWSQPTLNPDAPITPAEDAAALNFWRDWNDPTLLALIERTLAHNRELRQAAARVQEARALAGEARAQALPQVDAAASVARNRASGNDRMPLGALPNPVSQYRQGFDASWEVDLFGRLAREREAAAAQIEASQFQQDAMALRLAAETASVYLHMRAAQAHAVVREQQSAIAAEAEAVVASRVRAGLNPELDRLRAQDQRAQIDAELPPARAEIGLAIRQLGVLTGGQADSLLNELAPVAPLARQAPPLPRRLPAAWLDRRPDVRAAEVQLHAAQAQVGVAEGDRLPRLSFAAQFGWLSLTAGRLGDADSRMFHIGPQLSLPLFHGGALAARLDAARARHDQALLAWDKAVADAVLDVETAALREHAARDRHASRQRQLASRAQQVELARLRFERGLVDYTEPLEALRQWFAAQAEEIQAREEALNHALALYKALGGGWRGAPE